MPPHRPIQTVFLDAVGTLISPAEEVGVTYSRIAAGHGITIAPDATAVEFRRQISNRASPSYPGGRGSELIDRAWWEALVNALLDHLAAPGTPPNRRKSFFAELFEYYATPKAWCLFPETRTVLENLRLRRLNLAVISNFDARLRPVLKALEIDAYFCATVISSEIGATKPSARIFQCALTTTGTAPARALHVGDCPVADAEGARNAGIEHFLLSRPEVDLTDLLSHPRIPVRGNAL